MTLHVISQPELSKLRKSYAWRKLSGQVKAQEPVCRLQLDGCTQITTCVDHIIPAYQRPDLFLVRSYCIGSCASCNLLKGASPISALSTMKTPRALDFFDTRG